MSTPSRKVKLVPLLLCSEELSSYFHGKLWNYTAILLPSPRGSSGMSSVSFTEGEARGARGPDVGLPALGSEAHGPDIGACAAILEQDTPVLIALSTFYHKSCLNFLPINFRIIL